MPRPSRLADVLSALTALGGIADTTELVSASSSWALRSAVDGGLVVRAGRGVYTFAGSADPGLGCEARTRSWARWKDGPSQQERDVLTARSAIARGHGGSLSHLCAAAHHGWPILREPSRIDVAVPNSRNVRAVGAAVRVTRRTLTSSERSDHVTSPTRTVLDCAQALPFAEALAVADSALRSGAVGDSELIAAAEKFRGRGAGRVRDVAASADGRAANPFESALRAVHSGVPGLSLVPQFEVKGDGLNARVDLADPERRIVIEADSYAFHGDPELFEHTQRRQVELSGRDWIALPYGFRAVTRETEWVRRATEAVVRVRASRGYGRR